MKTPTHTITANPALYPLFRTASNRLTPYAFACGYLETYRSVGIHSTAQGMKTRGKEVEIWKDGGCSHYNIRAHDYDTGKRLFWEDRKTLTEARKLFDRTKRAMIKGEPVTATVTA